MAKHTNKSRKRKRGRYLRGRIDEGLSLGTLAAKTLVSDTWDGTVTERTLVSSIVATWMLNNLTGSQGPLLVGVAHSDYSDAQIEAVIENAGSWDEGDKIDQEIAKRLVRTIGAFIGKPGPSGVGDDVLNDGKPIKTKLNWILTEGDTLKMWVYNMDTAALVTTVPIVSAEGHANLWVL